MSALPSLFGLCLLKVRDGRITAINSEGARLLRTETSPDFANLPWTDALNCDTPEAAEHWLANGNRARPLHIRCNKGKRWLRLRAHPADGEWVLILEDVTAEREEIERDRLEAEHFHALIERSSEGISIFDTQSTILYESPSNKRIHGYEPHELEGRTLMSFCHPDDTARIALRFKRLAEAPGVVETEIVRFRHKQGHYIYLEGTVLNATDDPRLNALVNNFRDVTGRLEAERELRRAKSSAEEAHRLQQHFLTNLSHEFKTPLTLIRGPLETLAADPQTTDTERRTLGLVFRNIDRLDALLTELIDLARIEAGAFALHANLHDLCLFVRRQVEHFSEFALAKEIRIQLEAPDLCPVFFDATKLDKVLMNLLGNAIKFSPPNTTIRVKVTIGADGAGDGKVDVSVSDEGPGMDETTRARVFERFFQGDAGLERGHEGMGIGMAIAREMIEMHGGDLSVESEIGLGSTFIFSLPLGCDHLDPDDIDTSAVPEPRPHSIGSHLPLPAPRNKEDLTESNRPRPTLLLVEDNIDLRAYLRMHLDLFYDVRETDNGLAAIAALEDSLPDIVLSDVMMPHLNGLELCRQIKAEPRWSALPVILLSAKAAVDNRVEGLRAGADDYLSKPFSVPELLERLRARLPQKEPAPASAEVEWVNKLNACIAANLASPDFDVTELARQLGYSVRQLRRRVAEYFGQTPSALLLAERLRFAHELIHTQRCETVAEVAHAIGLSPRYFSRRYRHAFRCTEIPLKASSPAVREEFLPIKE
ncbi:MAG: response regulator [Puniceicoccaceae bacterium]|nr:MAG: response regulator [Puniceicoccaceae bacterium]